MTAVPFIMFPHCRCGGHERTNKINLCIHCLDLTNRSSPGNDFFNNVVAYGDVQDSPDRRAARHRPGRNRRLLRWERQFARSVAEFREALRARCSLSDGDRIESPDLATHQTIDEPGRECMVRLVSILSLDFGFCRARGSQMID